MRSLRGSLQGLHVQGLSMRLALRLFTRLTHSRALYEAFHEACSLQPGLGPVLISTSWPLQPGLSRLKSLSLQLAIYSLISTAWSPQPGLHSLVSTAWSLQLGLYSLVSTTYSLKARFEAPHEARSLQGPLRGLPTPRLSTRPALKFYETCPLQGSLLC